MERRHKQISEENEKFKEIIDHNQAAIYELEGKEFELQKLLDQKDSELQRMLEEVKYASEQQEIMKEKVDSLESQNNNLLSHNNKNQKMKYITKLKEDHNNAIDLSEKYKKELVAVKSKNKKLAAKESSSESKLRKIKSIANQLEQDSSLSLKDAVCLLLQALNSGPVLEDVTNKSYIHQSSSKKSHSKSFSSQKGFSKEESPFLKRSHTQNENLEPFKRNKTLSKETN